MSKISRVSFRIASKTLEVVHNTSLENALSILKTGFHLGNFGETARKTGQHNWLNIDPEGIQRLNPHLNLYL